MKKTDSELQQAVLQELKWDTRVDETDVGVEVDAGIVTLTGTVDSWAEVDYWTQREDADKGIRHLAGVRAVVNKIDVKPRPVPIDVRKSIEDALERRAEREAKRIDIEVRDGRVILSGTVRSWAEKNAVLGAAKGTVGVCSVDDRLRVAPYAA